MIRVLLLICACTIASAFEVEVGQLAITFPDETFQALMVRNPQPKYVLSKTDDSGAAVTKETHQTAGSPLAMVTVIRIKTDPAAADYWSEYQQYFIDDLVDEDLVKGPGPHDEVITASGLKGQRLSFGPITAEGVTASIEIIIFRLPGRSEAMLLQIYPALPDKDHPDVRPAVVAAVGTVRIAAGE